MAFIGTLFAVVFGCFAFLTAPLIFLGAGIGLYYFGVVGCIGGLILGILATAGLNE